MEQNIENPLPFEPAAFSPDQTFLFQRLNEAWIYLQYCRFLWKALIFYLICNNVCFFKLNSMCMCFDVCFVLALK